MTRRIVIAAAAGLALAAAAPAAAAPRVELMVAGKARVLREADDVRVRGEAVRVAGRRCRVGAGTPLAALTRTSLKLTLRDYGRCGRRPADAGGLYVRAVGAERERGRAGWVYKVGRRIGTTGAGDPSGPFGTGRRLRSGQRVLWFWCVRASRCQRTLEVRPAAREVAPGDALPVTVRGYDDQGRGRPVAGATVTLGSASALTGADGTATLTVPAGTGELELTAERAGLVPAFPEAVRIR